MLQFITTSLKPATMQGNTPGEIIKLSESDFFIKLELKSEMIWAYILMAIANFNLLHSRSYNNDPGSSSIVSLSFWTGEVQAQKAPLSTRKLDGRSSARGKRLNVTLGSSVWVIRHWDTAGPFIGDHRGF